jgi:hypothetical protein
MLSYLSSHTRARKRVGLKPARKPSGHCPEKGRLINMGSKLAEELAAEQMKADNTEAIWVAGREMERVLTALSVTKYVRKAYRANSVEIVGKVEYHVGVSEYQVYITVFVNQQSGYQTPKNPTAPAYNNPILKMVVERVVDAVAGKTDVVSGPVEKGSVARPGPIGYYNYFKINGIDVMVVVTHSQL